MSKLINVNYLHFIGCQSYTKAFKSRFMSNSSHSSSIILKKHTGYYRGLTAFEDHVIEYSETAFSNSNVNYFWSIINSFEVIEKLRLPNFHGS